MGGTITGEHGVGIEKINSMCVQFDAAENEQMFRRSSAPSIRPACSIRARSVPTLQRCAEFGKHASYAAAGCRIPTCRASDAGAAP